MAAAELYFGATRPSEKQGTDQESFLQWMDEKGISHNKCKLYCFPRTGRGVRAAVNLKKGEVVLEVPDDSVLLAETGSLSQRIDKLGITEDSETVLQSVPLVVTAMYERMRGASSPWGAYLSFLPQLQSMSLPFAWEEVDRKGLVGTSVMHRECCPPFDHPPADVDGVFKSTVLPFFAHLAHPGCVKEDNLCRLFRWATALVSSYSFELGVDKLQDLLNHVTGAKNVRLNHCADRGCLQMIATCKISKGDELINDYGPLSNGELLRRYGFVEPVSLFRDELELLAARASVAERVPGCATSCHLLWVPPNQHDQAILPLELILTALRLKNYPKSSLRSRLVFAKRCGIVPDTYRYTIDCNGTLDGAAAELFRLLAMDSRSFEAFTASLVAWRPGTPAPCASHCNHTMRPEFEDAWTNLVLSVLALFRAKMRPPSFCVKYLMDGKPGSVQTAEQAAAVVALGEWIAVDCCMARVSGIAIDGLSGRQLFLEADSALIPGYDGEDEKHSAEDLGGSWLLRLCKEWWESTGLQTLQSDDFMMDVDKDGENIPAVLFS